MFEKGCLGVITLCVALLLLSLVRLSNTLNGTVAQLRTDSHTEALKLDATLTDLDRDTVIASGTLTAIERGSRKWGKEQDQVAAKTLQAVSSLNSMLQAISGLAVAGSSLLQQQQVSLSALEDSAGQSISIAGSQLASLANQAAPVMVNLQTATKNASEASQSINTGLSEAIPPVVATTQHVEGTTKDVQAFVHRETTPVRGTYNIIKNFLFQLAGPAASVATSLK